MTMPPIHIAAAGNGAAGITFTIVGVLIFVGLCVAFYMIRQSFGNAVRSRVFTTRLTPDHIRHLFTSTVTGLGWEITSTGNPMIATSNILAGTRQSLEVLVQDRGDGWAQATIVVGRVSGVGVGGEWLPNKLHTLRIRMDRFEAAVRAADPYVQVTADANSRGLH